MPRGPASRHRSPLIGAQWKEDRSKVHVSAIIDGSKSKSSLSSQKRLRPMYPEKPMDGQRLAAIQRQNRLLEKRIENIQSKGTGLDNKNYLYDMNRINHSTIFRDRELARTHKENILIAKRLWDIKPFIRSDDWAKSYRNHERHVQLRTSSGSQASSPRASRRYINSETPRTNKKIVANASYC